MKERTMFLLRTYIVPIMPELFMILAGCIIYALSVIVIGNVHVIPGSVVGMGVICNIILGFPIGLVSLIFNIPIMIIATRLLGKKMLVYTIITLLGTSILVDLSRPLTVYIPLWNPFVISAIGGFLMGIGAGLLLKAGATLGGTTAIARLLQIRWPALRVGNALILMDSAIVISGVLLIKDFMAFFYSILFMIVCSKTIDLVLNGLPGKRGKPKY